MRMRLGSAGSLHHGHRHRCRLRLLLGVHATPAVVLVPVFSHLFVSVCLINTTTLYNNNKSNYQITNQNTSPHSPDHRSIPDDNSDPSALFLHSDTSSTPIMRVAKAFFEHINTMNVTSAGAHTTTLSAASAASAPPLPPFQIFLGKKTEWRCVAKLAVRHQPQGCEEEGEEGYSLPAIGLFAPGLCNV